MIKRRIAASLGALAIGLAGAVAVGSAAQAAGPILSFTADVTATNVATYEDFVVFGECVAADPVNDPIVNVYVEVWNVDDPTDNYTADLMPDATGFWASANLYSTGPADFTGYAVCVTYSGYYEPIFLPNISVVEVWATVNGYNPVTVVVGSTVVVEGGGFVQGETVDATLNSQPVFLGSGPAPNPKMTVTIPASTPLGAHTIVLQGALSGRAAVVDVNVVAGGRLPVIETGI